MLELITDKWRDALDHSEEWLERNLISEFLEDLAQLEGLKCLDSRCTTEGS
jgi:hypothetical protein